jgi:DNA-binding winged helix-turn-helix (wHTH) protein
MNRQVKPLYEFDRFCVDPKERLLLRDGHPIHLETKTFDILVAFVENSGHLLRKDELMSKVWGETFVEETNLAKRVADLRRTLGERPKEGKYIKTEHGQGYRFVAEVREVSKINTQKVDQEPGKAVAVTKKIGKLEGHKRSVIVIGAIMVMIIVGCSLAYGFKYIRKRSAAKLLTLPHESFIPQYRNEYIFHIARSSINGLPTSAKEGIDIKNYIVEMTLRGGGRRCEVQLWLKTWYGLNQRGDWLEITSEGRTFIDDQPLRFDPIRDPRGGNRFSDLSHVHAIGLRADKAKCDLQSIKIVGARLIKRD